MSMTLLICCDHVEAMWAHPMFTGWHSSHTVYIYPMWCWKRCQHWPDQPFQVDRIKVLKTCSRTQKFDDFDGSLIWNFSMSHGCHKMHFTWHVPTWMYPPYFSWRIQTKILLKSARGSSVTSCQCEQLAGGLCVMMQDIKRWRKLNFGPRIFTCN